MRTRERVDIIRANFVPPQKLGIVMLVVLTSFGVGIMPMVYGDKTSDTDTAPVTEATFWRALYK